MRELMVEKFGPKNIAGIFHEDDGEGFFFLYDSAAGEVLRQVQIYERPTVPEMPPTQVEIVWSADEQKSGLMLWGRMRALLPLDETEQEVVYVTEQPEDPSIDAANLTDFPQYFDRRKLLTARKEYWISQLLQSHPKAVISNTPLPLTDTAFVKASFDSRRERAAIFEDEGETGYLYLFSVGLDKIEKHLHIYDRKEGLNISADDVEVLWSMDESKCAVMVWGKIRGIIDLRLRKEGRVWLESETTPGISDRAWLKGFELI